MKKREVTVPKIAGQCRNPALYECLKDMVKRTSDEMSKVGVDITSTTDGLTIEDVQKIIFENILMTDDGDRVASLIAYLTVEDENGTVSVKAKKISTDINGMAVVDMGNNEAFISNVGLRVLHGFASDYVTPIIFYSPTLSNPSITYNEGTRTLTLTRPVLEFDFAPYFYWYRGQPIEVNSDKSLAHTNATGSYFYTMDSTTGNLIVSTTAWNILTDIPVAYVYYNATTGKGICLHELHGKDRNLSLHEYAHTTFGTQALTGFAISGYTLNTSTDAGVTYAIASGTVVDEDIRILTDAVADGGPYVILERSGASGDWTYSSANTLPFIKGTTYPVYNKITTGSWGRTELSGAGSGEWCNYWVFATTHVDSTKRVFIVMSQNVYTSLSAAQAEGVITLDWGTIPFTEIAPLYRITLHARSSYGGTAKCRIEDVQRLVGSRSSLGTIAAVTVHNSLSGRSDPDTHPASAITNTPAGAIAATTVQAALNELDTEKLANSMSTARLLGRTTAGAGAVEEISVGSGLTLSAGVLDVASSGGKVLRAQEYTSGTTTFTTASGVTEVWVTGCGAGGGCGGEETDTAHGGVGGGGGGESVYRKKLTVTASTGYTVTIGAGGTAGTSSATAGSVTAGSAGGATSFGALLTLAGGAGSAAVTGTSTGIGAAAGGPGGTSGANGFPPITGASGTTAVNGAPGVSFPGGWGTGGYHGASSGMRAGRSGYLLVEWNE